MNREARGALFRRNPASTTLALGVALGVVLSVGCSDPENGGGGDDDSELVFPKDPAASGYVQVRACRAPGEHSALSGFDVWVDGDSAAAFEELWAEPQARSEMPASAVVLKVTYDSSDCATTTTYGYFAMEKRPGFDPAGGDWYWQELAPDGRLVVDGKDAGCTGCHEGGASTTCVGYGEENGLDYLCTEP